MRFDPKILVLTSIGAFAGLALYGPGPGPDVAGSDPDLPLAETGYVLGDGLDAYESFMMSGGPPPDGIPSIDDPVFVDADASGLDADDRVIGFHHEGEARAYPHAILVQHEIVNDRVGGTNVAITYCPLTATAQAFLRGSTTLGVSGQLLNSNLVMYDRETESYFAQINATGLNGRYRGETLVELDVVWTTWGRWLSEHPETLVLSRETGYLRNYDRDPYGSYDPLDGYYRQDRTIFPLMHDSDRHHAKEMVVGARIEDRSAYFPMADLERDRIQATDSFVAVYDPDLDTGHIYLAGEEEVEIVPREDGGYEFRGASYDAGELPLDRMISLEAFYFAWNAFFPESEFPDVRDVR